MNEEQLQLLRDAGLLTAEQYETAKMILSDPTKASNPPVDSGVADAYTTQLADEGQAMYQNFLLRNQGVSYPTISTIDTPETSPMGTAETLIPTYPIGDQTNLVQPTSDPTDNLNVGALPTRPSGLDTKSVEGMLSSGITFPQLPGTSAGLGSVTSRTPPKEFGTNYEAYLKYKAAVEAGTLRNEDYSDADIVAGKDVADLAAKKEGATQTRTDQERLNALQAALSQGSGDIGSDLFTLGRGIGAEKGSAGRLANIIGGGGSALFAGARNVLSGIGYSKANQYSQNYYDDLLNKRKYKNASQTQNANNQGEMPMKYGGLFEYEDGGSASFEGEQPQQEQQGGMEEIAQVALQMLQQGATPDQVVTALIKKGVPHKQAMQIVQEVTQQEPQEPEASEEEPQMKGGGTFRHKVGDYVEFSYGGEMHKGKISRIENGQIYL